MDASFFSKPLSQLECRDNKKSCHLLEKKGTHPMRMHDNNTKCNRSNQNAGFLDITNTTCNRSNQNARLPDTHSCSTNQHPTTPDTTKTTCYQSAAQCWKASLVTGICLSMDGQGEVTSNASWDRSHGRVTPPPHMRPEDFPPPRYIRPGHLPLWGNICRWQKKLKHVQFPSGRYASYWNAFLFNLCKRFYLSYKISFRYVLNWVYDFKD